MESNTNVVMFPKAKKNHPPQTLEDIQDDIQNIRSSKAEDVVSVCMMSIMDAMEVNGIDISDPDIPENLKYNTWVLEAIRVLVYGKLGLEHPWKYIPENLFAIEKHPEYTDLNVVTWEYDNLTLEGNNELTANT